METSNKNSIFVVAGLLVLVAALAVWWVMGGLGNIMPGNSQSAAVAAALLTDDTYAIVSETWTNTLNAGLETAVTGAVCYTIQPATAPISINGVTTTPLTQATVPCPAQVGLDQAAALAALNGQSCTSIGTNVDLNTIIIGVNPPGTFPPGCYSTSGMMDIVLNTTVTLDATAPGGDGGSVWIFRSAGALTTGANSLVALVHGADASKVFWTPGSTASIGANSSSSATPTFVGTIIADSLGSTGVNLGHFVNLLGRVLAFGHTVTTDSNTIVVPTPATAAPILHVIKSVINVSGGTAVASDFTVHVTSATSSSDVAGSPQLGTSTPGTLYTLSTGTFNISEDTHAGYTQTFGGACAPSGTVVLGLGDDLVCTIINTDIPPPAPVPSSGGSGSFAPQPLIALTKIPAPLSLPGGPGPVVYTYTATNIGVVAMSGVSVKDDLCAPVTFVSGDTNNDSKLDLGEAWVYRCTRTVPATQTNTATAHGSANGWDGYAVALATVVVGPGLPNTGILPPLIHVTKVPSRLTPFPMGGGMVTYTYAVTNPGVVPLQRVTLTDDKCSPVSGHQGDSNGNNMLEPGEVWTYTCSSNVPVSTRNTATAAGQANGFIALGYALVDVLVGAPGLPNTGLPPKGY